jgi:hypothetical protein
MFLFDWPGGSWQATMWGVAIIFFVYLAALWLTLVFWTYRDIRQRTRDPIVQVVAVMLVLLAFLPGHWIYLILRPRYTLTELYERSLEEEALLQELEDQKACPTCRRRVHDDFLICPSCRTQLKETCRSCAKPLSYAWVACPFCGLEKPPREGLGPRPARQPVRAGQPATRPLATTTTDGPRRPAELPRPVQAAPAPQRPAPATSNATTAAPSRDPFRAPPRLAEEGPVIGTGEERAPGFEARG